MVSDGTMMVWPFTLMMPPWWAPTPGPTLSPEVPAPRVASWMNPVMSNWVDAGMGSWACAGTATASRRGPPRAIASPFLFDPSHPTRDLAFHFDAPLFCAGVPDHLGTRLDVGCGVKQR